MFSASEISRTIQELDQTVNRLSNWTGLIAMNRQPLEQSSSRKALKLGKNLRQIRRFAADLHQAILQAWKSGCHKNHEANLFLEDRIETAASIPRGFKRDADFTITVFQLIFATSSPQNDVSWHEAAVKVSRELVDEGPNPLDELPVCRNSQVTIVLPERASTGPAIPPINDICAVLASTRQDQNKVSLILEENQRMRTAISKEDPVIPCHHAEKVTLKALLCDTEPTSRRTNFPLRPRMMLALGLASNLLQLSRTPWLRMPWSKDEIFFLRRPSAAGHYYDFSRPFVSLTFNSRVASTQPQEQIDPKVAFLELGILLLEIWNSETLETHFPGRQSPTEYYQRLALATKWLDDTNNRPLDCYDKAVSHCIRGMMGGETRFPDWEDVKFWGAVCQDVIDPLHEICKQWRSLPC